MLFPLFLIATIAGVARVQGVGAASVPVEERKGLRDAVEQFGNLTLINTTEDKGHIIHTSRTSSSAKDENFDFVEELSDSNMVNVTTEDDEHFQDVEQEFLPQYCDEEMLLEYSYALCGSPFQEKMSDLSPRHWCDFHHIITAYNEMTLCLERLSVLIHCYFPLPEHQTFFLDIHSQFFQGCSTEKSQLQDPPYNVVITLTLIPVSLIPVLVFLVACKSNIRQ